jgi:hypothetical protein
MAAKKKPLPRSLKLKSLAGGAFQDAYAVNQRKRRPKKR